jgi:hypothetical protein
MIHPKKVQVLKETRKMKKNNITRKAIKLEDKEEISLSQKKYIVLSDGVDFRTVSKKMTEAGWTMNHATARNHLMVAMKNFVYELSKELKMGLTEESIQKIISNNDMHENLVDVLHTIVKEDINTWK